MREPPDRDLLAAVAAGHGAGPEARAAARSALEMLYDRHAAAVLHLAERLLGDGWAEDVLQDVFVTVARHAGRYRGCRNPSARGWLLAIAGNRARDLRRGERRQRRREEEVARPGVVAPASTPEDRDELDVRLAGLPEGQRLALELRLRHGLGFTEVAAAIGVSVRTAKYRVAGALERLRRGEGAT